MGVARGCFETASSSPGCLPSRAKEQDRDCSLAISCVSQRSVNGEKERRCGRSLPDTHRFGTFCFGQPASPSNVQWWISGFFLLTSLARVRVTGTQADDFRWASGTMLRKPCIHRCHPRPVRGSLPAPYPADQRSQGPAAWLDIAAASSVRIRPQRACSQHRPRPGACPRR